MKKFAINTGLVAIGNVVGVATLMPASNFLL